MRYETGYKHWSGRHRGIWMRRVAIAENGLRGCLRGKWVRFILSAAWLASLVQIAALFLLGQLLIQNSIAVQWLGQLNPQLQSLGQGLITWLVMHPEISVHTTYNLLFYFFSTYLIIPSMIAVALAIPHLITRDLSSNAIIIYSSKAVGRFDYLLGKFGAVFGLLTLTWLGPVCVAWFVGNLLTTDWHFFWHSRRALGNCLTFVLSGMTVLSLLGMGVSAISSREKTTVAIWVAWWLFGSGFVSIGKETKPWLKHLSLRFDLDQISIAVFRLGNDLQVAQDNLPFFGQLLRGVRRQTMAALNNPEITGAGVALFIMLSLAAAIILWKVRPE